LAKAIQKTIKRHYYISFCYFSIGILFVILQFMGFGQIVQDGYYFTGSESSITTTFLYVVTVVHLIHLAGGVISLLIIIYNHFKQNTIQVKLLE
jgi:cytochrome c oxidase subunit 3